MSHPEEPVEIAPDPEPAAHEPAAPPPSFLTDGGERPLAPAWITVSRINGLIRAAVFTAIAAVGLTIAVVASDTVTLAAGAMAFVSLSLVFVLPALLWPPVAYRYSSYRFTEEGIQLRRGAIWRSQVAVSRSRIQHTDVSQGPIERIYGLATLTVHTAGNHYAAIALPGLDHAEALLARDFLLAARAADFGDAV